MGTLKTRIQFYRTLATLEDAGISRVRALEQRHQGRFAPVAKAMAAQIQRDGILLNEAMAEHPRLFSEFERGLVMVGESTGRASLAYGALSDWFTLRQRLRSQVISQLIYPVLVYHVAAVLLPVVAFFTNAATAEQAVRRAVCWLAAPYVLYFLLFVVWPRLLGRHGIATAVSASILHIPVLGKVVRKLNYTRFFHAYAMCVQTGVGTPRAAELAAGSCTNAHLRTRLGRLPDVMRAEGCTFTEAFSQALHLNQDNMIVTMMQTGELSGNQDEMAARIADIYGREAEESLKRAATIIPILLYLILAAYIGFQVIGFYARLIGQYTGIG